MQRFFFSEGISCRTITVDIVVDGNKSDTDFKSKGLI